MANDRAIDMVAAALRGPKPFNPATDEPQDVGLGGMSTEYLAGGQDQMGNEFVYPQIWYIGGKAVLLEPDAAYQKALDYEAATGKMFPRYRNSGAGSFAAENRSAMGGAEQGLPLMSTWPARNF